MDPPLLPKPELHVLSIDEVTEIAKKCIKNICINEDTGEYEKYIPEVYVSSLDSPKLVLPY